MMLTFSYTLVKEIVQSSEMEVLHHDLAEEGKEGALPVVVRRLTPKPFLRLG